MRTHLNRSITAAIMTLLVAGTLFAGATTPLAAQDKTVVVHLGTLNDDWQSTLMAMGVATNLLRAGADVTVYVDRNAVRMAEPRQPLGVILDRDVGTMVEEFVEMGGRFLVCGHCAGIAGVDGRQLRPGFTIGGPEDVAAIFMAADIVVSF